MNNSELRKRREHMGLCTTCGGMKSNPQWKTCEKCRDKGRQKCISSLVKQIGSYDVTVKVNVQEVRPEHKCWTCEWSKYLGDRFFCPFVEGTCVKEDKE